MQKPTHRAIIRVLHATSVQLLLWDFGSQVAVALYIEDLMDFTLGRKTEHAASSVQGSAIPMLPRALLSWIYVGLSLLVPKLL